MIPLDILKVTIIPEQESEGGCEVDLETFFFKNAADIRPATIDLVKFHLAGKMAERKYFDERAIDGSSILKYSACYDDAQIEYYLDTIQKNGQTPIDLEAVTKETAKIIESPAGWSAITRLAGALVREKQLQGEDLPNVLADFTLT